MVAVTTDNLHRPAAGARVRHLRLVAISTAPAVRRTAVPRAGAPALRPSPATFRRRRLLVGLAAFTVVALAVTVWSALGPSAGSSLRSSPVAATFVEVRPGDTIWAIARRAQPSGDVRPLVDRLAAAHGGGALHVGERIPVPAA